VRSKAKGAFPENNPAQLHIDRSYCTIHDNRNTVLQFPSLAFSEHVVMMRYMTIERQHPLNCKRKICAILSIAFLTQAIIMRYITIEIQYLARGEHTLQLQYLPRDIGKGLLRSKAFHLPQ
jgi:hypothetical protein